MYKERYDLIKKLFDDFNSCADAHKSSLHYYGYLVFSKATLDREG